MTEEPKLAEGKQIVANLAGLKYELQHDRKLTYSNAPCVYCCVLTKPDLFPRMANLILHPIIKNSSNWDPHLGSMSPGSLLSATSIGGLLLILCGVY